MTMFEVYSEEIEIKNQDGTIEKYRIKPLPGKYLAKMYNVISKMEGSGGGDIDLSSFNEKTMEDLHEICFETFKRSYPNEKVEDLELFVSQNLMKLVEGVFKVNINNEEMKK